MEIILKRSFMPEKVAYGLNLDTNDGVWFNNSEHGDMTMFQTKDQYVLVIFSWNPFMQCTELSFMTALKSKVNCPDNFMEYATYQPDEDMTLDPNRGTDVFRKVTYVAMQKVHEYKKIGFYGATEWLDRVYGRLIGMKYLHEMLDQHHMRGWHEGKHIYFEQV